MSVRKKRKKIDDFEITHHLLELESEIYDILENAPKKYNFNLKQQAKEILGAVKYNMAKSLALIPYSKETWEEKRYILNNARSDLTTLTLTLIQHNNKGAISNDTKSYLDYKMATILQEMRSLLSTFTAKIKGSDGQGCALAAESEMIKTHDCDGSGGDNA